MVELWKEWEAVWEESPDFAIQIVMYVCGKKYDTNITNNVDSNEIANNEGNDTAYKILGTTS